jgi:hypothetical protein
MSNRHKKQAKPNIAPAALLRARLERQWRDPAAAQLTAAQLEAGLEAAAQGLRPDVVLGAILSVFPAAKAEVQAVLQTILPGWLARRNGLEALESLVAGELPAAPRALAMSLLAAAGRDVVRLNTRPGGSFHSAYDLDDGSQAAMVVLWYSSVHGNRVRGIQFLIDYNPPWEGAIKDAFMLPSKSPEVLIQRQRDVWAARGLAMDPVSAAEAKLKLLQALAANRSAEVRLSKDLIALREPFIEQVLSLPDLPETPPFTPGDFDELSRTGTPAEDLAQFEQVVGRRIRLEDGKEVFVDASIANMDDDEWLDELE